MSFVKKAWKYIINPKKIIYYLKEKRLHSSWGEKLDDETYLKRLFKLRMGYELNLEEPKTYNEKLQWLKLYDRKPIYTDMVDKYEAKKYVAAIIGEEYIIPTLGVWDKVEDIDFNSLPNQFVLKCTHDSGGLVICRDKKNLDLDSVRAKLERSLKRDYFIYSREWPYKNVKHRIIAEQYMETGGDTDLIDYKFYCFNGEPKFLYISHGLSNHATARISYVSFDWKKQPFKRNDYADFEELPPKPINFDKMIELSRKLSVGVAFLRVDFYEINGKIYFGELTFFPGAGLTKFDPSEWDEKLGEWIKLPQKKANK